MKNIMKIGVMTLISIFVLFACSPQEKSDYALGAMPTADQLDFSIIPTAAKANIIDIKNTSKVAGVATWDFGNGSKSKGESAAVQYPLKGTYTVVLTLYTSGGSATISKTITIANDDMTLLNTPMYNALTGGAAKLEGKTWVFDQYYGGHFGKFPNDNSWSWYAGANDKDGCSLYTQKFTFTQIGVKFQWTNNGSVYTNAAGVTDLASKGYTTSVATPVGDFDVVYAPKPSYTFSMNEAAKTITLSDGAFFGFYAGTSTYKIRNLTADVLELEFASILEPGTNWVVRLIPIEKNIKPIIPMKAVPLSEDFEAVTPKVPFANEDMGSLTNSFYSNPAPLGLNTSGKVFLYQKSGGFYSNIFFTASGYKFDLAEQNKITLKVFIPSYNDYTTSFATAGSWVSNDKLKPQVSVKLQNASLGGNAYTTQTEIIKADLEKDKWIDLTFDFSGVSTRLDYDKIVIQFGAEGHAAPGIFFLDDFKFKK